MKCCDIEPIVVGAYPEEKDNKKYHVIIYQCVNPQCDNYESKWEEKIPVE